MRYFIQTIHLERDLSWQQGHGGQFKYHFDFNIKIQQYSNANIWLDILPSWRNGDGLKHPAGQEHGAPREMPTAAVVTTLLACGICQEKLFDLQLSQHTAIPQRAPCSIYCTERKSCSWPQKKYCWSREPQSSDSPNPMNGPPERTISDKQRSSKAIFKVFPKILPEPECYPRIPKDLSRSEIPLCARTWVWKQL